jgi:outer membrane protein assembly factor BamA
MALFAYVYNFRISVFVFAVFLMVFSPAAKAQKADTIPSIKKKKNLAVIPILSYNRSYGVTGGVMANYFMDLNKKDTISPASVSGFTIGYTQNRSWAAIVMQRLFLKEDKIRLVWAAGSGKINFQYYELAAESFVDYHTATRFVFVSGSYQVMKHFFAGLQFQNSRSTTTFSNTAIPSQYVSINRVGLPLSYDTRNNVYTPTKGLLLNSVFTSNAKWLGNDIAFGTVSLAANYYKPLSERAVLASRIYFYAGLGNVPFIGQKAIGGKDIRGYTQGEFRSDKIASLQSEYRYAVNKKIGVVGFAGIGTAFRNDSIPGSGLLPGAGVGFRYKVIPQRNINAGIDIAAGKRDWGIYFRITEAF